MGMLGHGAAHDPGSAYRWAAYERYKEGSIGGRFDPDKSSLAGRDSGFRRLISISTALLVDVLSAGRMHCSTRRPR